MSVDISEIARKYAGATRSNCYLILASEDVEEIKLYLDAIVENNNNYFKDLGLPVVPLKVAVSGLDSKEDSLFTDAIVKCRKFHLLDEEYNRTYTEEEVGVDPFESNSIKDYSSREHELLSLINVLVMKGSTILLVGGENTKEQWLEVVSFVEEKVRELYTPTQK